ncbi:multicopper oxidase [Aulographum hederae CBS 113979]|uniref:Multicopper oxidase n=1 Tax=Aulographum hederae CBS 113979 TaxID=1176131 RepID=A0A6G1GLL2_9PEZI|nr:multicopper oxidase [Aulographum hederae CBS 113979]
MVAAAPFLTAVSALSSCPSPITQSYQVTYVTYLAVETVYAECGDLCAATPSPSASTSSVSLPPCATPSYPSGWPDLNGVPNPNGPYLNPYDSSSLPFTWPGLPSKGQTAPPPRPTAPYSYGGPAAGHYQPPCWAPAGVSSLVPALPQSDTNGNSPWGLPDCPHLPVHGLPPPGSPSGIESYGSELSSLFASSTPSASAPGSSAPVESISGSSSSVGTASGSSTTTLSASVSYSVPANSSSLVPSSTASACPTANACGKMPDTGVTRTYDFHVGYQTIAPDGVKKNGLVVNGGFPGPLIEANWGDMIEIKVTNDLPDEGTSLHWHGLLQKDTPFFDGVVAVSQCPIVPGGSLTYKFRADMYGTSWYHSHYSAQYAGGAVGPMIIHGPCTQQYDIDIGPVMLTDWYHQDYFTLVNDTMNGKIPPSNNNLINGKGNYPCANTTLPCTPNAGISKFKFQSGKKHLLRLINTGAEGTQKFSIDGHNMTIIANDFIPINPYETDVVTLGVGQRSDVIVEATGSSTDVVWMRSTLGTTGCSLCDGISPEAVAAIYYEDASTTAMPQTTSSVSASSLAFCGNDPLSKTTALCPVTPDPSPSTTETVNIEFGSNGTNFVWFMNNSSFRGDYNSPVLLDAKAGNLTFEPEWNVYDFGTNASVRMIIKNNFTFGAHPMHLHGHNFHVLAEGFGDWDGVVTNPENTQMRDVQMVRAGDDEKGPAFIVLQWKQDNPSVWPLHCHIAYHVSAGLYINVLERPEDVMAMEFDGSAAQTCRDWNVWTGTHVPDQIDSGL